MASGRRLGIPESETKDFVAHSGIGSMHFMFILVAFGPTSPMGMR